MSAVVESGYGYCHCGCGETTSVARDSDASAGYVKGEPVKYIRGHNGRKAVRYEERDCGFETPCWVWILARRKDGYGWSWHPGRKKVTAAHRVYYEQHVGPIPDGMEIDHLCKNPPCVNPGHMEVVTPHENKMRGRAGVNAAKTHCKNGHPFDQANTKYFGHWRQCRTCANERRRAERAS